MTCVHDYALLRDGQLADDEIGVVLAMKHEGRCPVCPQPPVVFEEYTARVHAVRALALPSSDVPNGGTDG